MGKSCNVFANGRVLSAKLVEYTTHFATCIIRSPKSAYITVLTLRLSRDDRQLRSSLDERFSRLYLAFDSSCLVTSRAFLLDFIGLYRSGRFRGGSRRIEILVADTVLVSGVLCADRDCSWAYVFIAVSYFKVWTMNYCLNYESNFLFLRVITFHGMCVTNGVMNECVCG